MRKLLYAALAALFALPAAAADFTLQWGVADTIEFTMFDADGLPLTGEVDGGAEVTLTCNDGAPATATNDFTETQAGGYQITLTAAELRCERLRMAVGASVAHTYMIETYGCGENQSMHYFGIERCGTVAAATATTITLDSGASSTNDWYNLRYIEIVDGTGQGQRRVITDYSGATKVATVSRPWDVTPTTSSLFRVLMSEVPIVSVDSLGVVQADMQRISGDGSAAEALEAALDGTGGVQFDATITGIPSAIEVATAVWSAVCEPDDADLYTCGEIMRLVLAYAWGAGDGAPDGSSWTTATPDGSTPRASTAYGDDPGDRTSSLTP